MTDAVARFCVLSSTKGRPCGGREVPQAAQSGVLERCEWWSVRSSFTTRMMRLLRVARMPPELESGYNRIQGIATLALRATTCPALRAGKDERLWRVALLVLGGPAWQALLLAAGAKGKRFAMPHSRILIHQVTSG